ncbi:hypothetical protein HYN49_01265 [Flavobacterium pallidum]|uniref:Uncharacterized protein n=1 Tax=Flavobacterium pallidum TaxID=2172098 RepID=A0A2S1SE25_9FLAO|nr:hypothetical protein HYN49_01265 [Flavobacterium pallidum]
MKEVENAITKYILSSPKALALMFFSFISGNLWIFIILSYLTKNTTKAVKHLDTYYSKISLGIIWFSIIMYPLHCLKYGMTDVTLENVFNIVWQTLLISLFLQGIITILILKLIKQ